MDTAGEFPQATDQPESVQVGYPGGSEFRAPDGPDEFASSIHRYSQATTSQLRFAGQSIGPS
jgi:hypothetical protein